MGIYYKDTFRGETGADQYGNAAEEVCYILQVGGVRSVF